MYPKAFVLKNWLKVLSIRLKKRENFNNRVAFKAFDSFMIRNNLANLKALNKEEKGKIAIKSKIFSLKNCFLLSEAMKRTM